MTPVRHVFPYAAMASVARIFHLLFKPSTAMKIRVTNVRFSHLIVGEVRKRGYNLLAFRRRTKATINFRFCDESQVISHDAKYNGLT